MESADVVKVPGGDQVSGAVAPHNPELKAALAAAETVVEAAIDLYSKPDSQIARRPDQVIAQVRRILTAGLALRTQLQGRSLVLGSELERSPKEVMELGRWSA